MTATDVVEAGWAELDAGRWDAARASFEKAPAGAETPRGLEGLSWAAWWLDDADTLFDARERAYRLYRRDGEPAAAARMATWIACDQLDFRGAPAVADGWLQRAARLLDPLEPGPDHGWLAFMQGYLLYAGGDSPGAAEHARRTTELGRRFEVPDLEMLGLALEGASLVSRVRVEAGMRRLDEATATALEGEATIPISGAWACCFLVTACISVLDYERANEWCARIAEFADRYGSRYMLAFCRAEYGAVHLWRGRWVEAETVLEGSVEDFARSRPAWTAGPLVRLAELRRRQGRQLEAESLLGRVGSSSAAQLCRARIALDRGDAASAAELAERVLRQTGSDAGLGRAPVLELLVRARTAQGKPALARAALEELREMERRVGTRPLRAGADLAEGALAAAGGDHERARRLLEDAVDGFEEAGAPYEAAEARLELAACMAGLGRDDDARREASAARERFQALGAGAAAARAQRILDKSDRQRGGDLGEITARERDVLHLLAEGLTNRQIAERLVVSEHTVHRHVTNILRKLGLPSRAAAAAYAVRSGLSAK